MTPLKWVWELGTALVCGAAIILASLVHNQVFFFIYKLQSPPFSARITIFGSQRPKRKRRRKRKFFQETTHIPSSLSRMLVCSFIFKWNWLLSCAKFFLILVFNCLFLVFICYILLVWLCCLFIITWLWVGSSCWFHKNLLGFLCLIYKHFSFSRSITLIQVPQTLLDLGALQKPL